MSDRIRRWQLGLGIALVGAATALGCAPAPAAVATATTKAGSLARFIVHNGYLYALSSNNQLLVYQTGGGSSPVKAASVDVPAAAETLFPHGELLFVGTREGMLVYDVATPDKPSLIGRAEHVYSCDPVVAQGNIAYVTLREGNPCRGGINALLVFDISKPTDPRQLAHKPLSRPGGLGVDGNTLFVVDAVDGLLVLDVRDPAHPHPIGELPDMKGYDLIANAGILIVSADDGVYQYEYGPEGLGRRVSRIPIGSVPSPTLVRAAGPDH
jgi:hypothetical protein